MKFLVKVHQLSALNDNSKEGESISVKTREQLTKRFIGRIKEIDSYSRDKNLENLSPELNSNKII
jgi:hypothetical protein